ncbi:MAG: hypothetical protein ABFR62_08580 [Bacteroidota bacterium]
MKNLLLLLLALQVSLVSFGQKKKKVEVDVQYIKTPKLYMPGIKSYAIIYDDTKLEKVLSANEKEYSTYLFRYRLNKYSIKGLASISSMKYDAENPDITITVISDTPKLDMQYQIKDVSRYNGPDYRACYYINSDWKVKIEGKYNAEFNLIDEPIEIVYPVINPENHTPIKDKAITENLMSKVEDSKIINIANTAFINKVIEELSNNVSHGFGYEKHKSEIVIKGFKSSKKHDMSEWEKITPEAEKMLNEISAGNSPEKVYEKYKYIFDFWKAQFDIEIIKPHKEQNSRILGASSSNICNILTLIKADEVKEEYIDYWKNYFVYKPEEVKFVYEMKERYEANKNNSEANYKQLKKALILSRKFRNRYPVTYTDKKGKVHEGIISLPSRYFFNPSESSSDFSLFSLEKLYETGNVTNDKALVNLKNVKSYKIFDVEYRYGKYYDPTAIGLPYKGFYEVVSDGKITLSKMYLTPVTDVKHDIIGGDNVYKNILDSYFDPQYFLRVDEKSTLIFNYKRLSDDLQDCQTVADKIKSGFYGNSKIEEKESGLGKLLQKGGHDRIEEEVVMKIVSDYNTLMK